MNHLLWLLSGCMLCILMTACDGDTRNRRAERGDNYVSDPDHLFFMNTRSRDYRSTTVEEGIDVFRHGDLEGEHELLIRNNWLEDRAELLLDGRVLSTTEARRLRDQLGSGNDTLELTTDTQREAVAAVLTDYLRLVGN
ncbi:hypothetical protein [Lewinella sp. IMCC34191]|uniref:hypothetical protein n=1 Tax=Lewinella sp. IMCC34191 TaxID=2259172 RepID=UPI000E2615E4|nr:hypothetical protein [Lewinella sp. IMCC34191]